MTKKRWADGAVMYQVYPRSFQDSNGDGVGDLNGITQRLDYLKELGVTGMWLSPFYPSPMADFGYDIRDYCNVDQLFGTLADFKRLLREAHKRDLHIIVDIVPNHSSDEHPWFLASKTSRTGSHADWYIWKDAVGFKGGKPVPPNNWRAMFDGKSAWQWVPERAQFYYHTFHKRQPDLNWENPEVRNAMKDVLRFWLRLGVDGFRVDAVPFMAKDPEFHNEPANPHYNPEHNHNKYWSLEHINNQYWPKLYEYLHEFSNVLLERPFQRRPRFMVTEGYTPRHDLIGEYLRYFQAMNPEVAAPFIFEGVSRPWSARDWRAWLRDFHSTLEGFNPRALSSYAFGNHDQSRIVSRHGVERARAIAVLELTLPGMPYIYQGDELGMHDVAIPENRIQDPAGQVGESRDPERTPMQWSPAPFAGFSNVVPWLPVAGDYADDNVAVESIDSSSFLNLYKSLISERNSSAALRTGTLRVDHVTDDHVLAFTRQYGKKRYTTVVNFAEKPASYPMQGRGRVIISSLHTPHNADGGTVHLRPLEAVLIKHR